MAAIIDPMAKKISPTKYQFQFTLLIANADKAPEYKKNYSIKNHFPVQFE